MGALESSLNTAAFVFKQDKDIRLVGASTRRSS
jgi:hypothetical protein